MAFITVAPAAKTTRRPMTALYTALARWNPQRMMAIKEQRRMLADLDDHLLSDIGITRNDAEREAARSFWDV